jgi:hypothetical protein
LDPSLFSSISFSSFKKKYIKIPTLFIRPHNHHKVISLNRGPLALIRIKFNIISVNHSNLTKLTFETLSDVLNPKIVFLFQNFKRKAFKHPVDHVILCNFVVQSLKKI